MDGRFFELLGLAIFGLAVFIIPFIIVIRTLFDSFSLIEKHLFIIPKQRREAQRMQELFLIKNLVRSRKSVGFKYHEEK